MKSRFGAVLLFPVLAVVLSGCMKLEANLTVSEDNLLSSSMVLSMAKTFTMNGIEIPNEAVTSSQALCDLLTSRGAGGFLPTDGTMTPDDSDPDSYGCRIEISDQPIPNDSTVQRVDDRFVFAVEPENFADSTDIPGMTESDWETVEQMGASIVFSVTFPGKIISTDAQRTEGTTVIWDDVYAIITTGMHAEAEATPSTGGMSPTTGGMSPLVIGLIAGGGALLIGAIVAAVLITRSRKAKAEAAAHAAYQPTFTPQPPYGQASYLPQAPSFEQDPHPFQPSPYTSPGAYAPTQPYGGAQPPAQQPYPATPSQPYPPAPPQPSSAAVYGAGSYTGQPSPQAPASPSPYVVQPPAQQQYPTPAQTPPQPFQAQAYGAPPPTTP